jgi:23S rRNA (pseudouridine1915-N3)-methyltransferase
MKLYIYFIGKPRDSHANAIAADFVARASRYVPTEMREIRPERFEPWTKHRAARHVYLDVAGARMDSAGFTAMIRKAELEGRDIVFAVGGHDGLPAGWAERAGALVSLSPMTFPHEMARAMLAEQVYRAFATLRGHPYPR